MGGVGGSGKGKRPIGVKFEIPYFTTSGIQVRYLKIIEPKVSRLSAELEWQHHADLVVAAIPLSAVGTIYHTVWRHRCATAGRAIREHDFSQAKDKGIAKALEHFMRYHDNHTRRGITEITNYQDILFRHH